MVKMDSTLKRETKALKSTLDESTRHSNTASRWLATCKHSFKVILNKRGFSLRLAFQVWFGLLSPWMARREQYGDLLVVLVCLFHFWRNSVPCWELVGICWACATTELLCVLKIGTSNSIDKGGDPCCCQLHKHCCSKFIQSFFSPPHKQIQMQREE